MVSVSFSESALLTIVQRYELTDAVVSPVTFAVNVTGAFLTLKHALPALRRSPHGAAVLLDPATGDVIAFTSIPAYDPNAFASGIDRETWRPSHIHYWIRATGYLELITQLYFQGDPLIPLCPIVNTIKDPAAIDQLTAKLDMANMVPFDSLVYRFDIVLRGRRATFFENRPEGN